MAERGIPMTAPMVQATLREIERPGTGKRITRRVLKPQPATTSLEIRAAHMGGRKWKLGALAHAGYGDDWTVPYAVGDVLWMREKFYWPHHRLDENDQPIGDPEVVYAADGYPYRFLDPDRDEWRDSPPWKSSRFMPRRLARILLDVTDVRVERLADISEEDAIAEGMIWRETTPEEAEDHRQWARERFEEEGRPYTDADLEPVSGLWYAPGTRQGFGPRRNDMQWAPTAACAFRFTWDSINSKRVGASWADNPWIVAVSFRPRLADAAQGPPLRAMAGESCRA